ncbi:hypothetical protein SAMN05660874_04765 [Saccharopolyspora flava]|uniref:Syndecan 1 n=1 Tax=Saccharopolyspora flava TaxID=95161 RepID=A0A1I6UCA9_9PSEU|nr:hypothetical protein SAMN05660874_04765 [Saccharopolyspora flava]
MSGMGHLVDPTAPSGLVHGLLRPASGVPVQRSTSGDLPVRGVIRPAEPHVQTPRRQARGRSAKGDASGTGRRPVVRPPSVPVGDLQSVPTAERPSGPDTESSTPAAKRAAKTDDRANTPSLPLVRPHRLSPPLTVARRARSLPPRQVTAIRPVTPPERTPADPTAKTTQQPRIDAIQRTISPGSTPGDPLPSLPPTAIIPPKSNTTPEHTPASSNTPEPTHDSGTTSESAHDSTTTHHDTTNPPVLHRTPTPHDSPTSPHPQTPVPRSSHNQPTIQRSPESTPEPPTPTSTTRPRLGIGPPIPQLPTSAHPLPTSPPSGEDSFHENLPTPHDDREHRSFHENFPTIQPNRGGEGFHENFPVTSKDRGQGIDPVSRSRRGGGSFHENFPSPHDGGGERSFHENFPHSGGEFVQRSTLGGVESSGFSVLPAAVSESGSGDSSWEGEGVQSEASVPVVRAGASGETGASGRAGSPHGPGSSAGARYPGGAGASGGVGSPGAVRTPSEAGSASAAGVSGVAGSPGEVGVEARVTEGSRGWSSAGGAGGSLPVVASSGAVQRVSSDGVGGDGIRSSRPVGGAQRVPVGGSSGAQGDVQGVQGGVQDGSAERSGGGPSASGVSDGAGVGLTVQRQALSQRSASTQIGGHRTSPLPVRSLIAAHPLNVRTGRGFESASTETHAPPTTTTSPARWNTPGSAIQRTPTARPHRPTPPPTSTTDLVPPAPRQSPTTAAPATAAPTRSAPTKTPTPTSPPPPIQRSPAPQVPGVPAGVPVTVVQREAAPPEPRPEPAPARETDTEELARSLVEPVSRLLRAELRHGRERLGRLNDRRR